MYVHENQKLLPSQMHLRIIYAPIIYLVHVHTSIHHVGNLKSNFYVSLEHSRQFLLILIAIILLQSVLPLRFKIPSCVYYFASLDDSSVSVRSASLLLIFEKLDVFPITISCLTQLAQSHRFSFVN